MRRSGHSGRDESGNFHWRPSASPHVPPLTLMVVMDHQAAKIYRIDSVSGETTTLQIAPYDPHHFLHHLRHKGQSREPGQRAPEEPGFYERISDALAAGGRILVVGHGRGTSNAAQHLTEFLRTHRREIYQRVVREIGVDLSSITTRQLLALAEKIL